MEEAADDVEAAAVRFPFKEDQVLHRVRVEDFQFLARGKPVKQRQVLVDPLFLHFSGSCVGLQLHELAHGWQHVDGVFYFVNF